MTTVSIPTLHTDQVRAYHHYTRNRFFVLRAGRRYGKTDFVKTIAADGAIKRETIGYFAPDYKRMIEVFNETSQILHPVRRSQSQSDGVFRTITGGRIDFWTLEDEDAGRSRRYHKVIIDEAAFTKPKLMMKTWQRAIKPTLLDFGGRAIIASNTNGVSPDNFFWQICNEPEHGFGPLMPDGTLGYHAPTRNNPYLPREDLDALQRSEPPLVFKQEYEAEFVDWSGVAFFSRDKFLDDYGRPVAYPANCDAVYAVIDTAIKTGSKNDGTAVTFYAKSEFYDTPLVILDYDYIQIEGGSLIDWLPSVFERAEQLAVSCGARLGVAGVWIEDVNSGTILIQHALKNGWNAVPISSELTAKGKDPRAFSVSAYHHQGLCKISEYAYNKTITFKGSTINHFLSQVCGFRVGDPDAAKRADDLLDTYTYGLSLGLGNALGY